ncbi:MAG: hypothetical protein ABJM29_07165 [Rhizobiaceae bacterium]
MTDTSATVGQARVSAPQVRISAVMWDWLKRAYDRMQHAQMIRAMTMLSDEVLLEIGVKRSEIPDHCKKLLDQSQS